ncbi:MAG: hypothetical protein COV76_08275 [Candidatus Omnitrophica bacterium CG11_big_fil_rev_8_21_14_0_20_64_10]|nr:MAG: hypothetical protein COV76_08275 [Candidatus Omnitrophica bacterium CG11_big_fil_rev_8_21_14_0_20_64_10]
MRRVGRWLLVVGLLAVVIGWWWQHRTTINPSALRAWIAQFGAAAPFIYVALYAANTVTLLPPIGVLSLTAGLAFGPAIGFLAIMAGAMIGTSLTFLISRRLGRGFVEHRLKGRFKSLDEALERRGFATVLFFRVVPIVPYEALNYVSGLSKIRFRDYGLATFLGLLPGAAVAAFFGDSLTQPFSPKFIAAVGALVLLIAIPTIYLKLRRKVPHGAD